MWQLGSEQIVGYPEVIQIATWGSVPTSRHLVRKSSTEEMRVWTKPLARRTLRV
jgi:hypothetical protein